VSCSTPCSDCLDCRSLGVGAALAATSTPAPLEKTSWPTVALTAGLIGVSIAAFVFALKHAGR